MQLYPFSPDLYLLSVPWAPLCCPAWFAGVVAPGAVVTGGVATAALFGFTALSPAVVPGIAGSDELPLTEPPNVEGDVTDEPEFPIALFPPAALPAVVPEVVAVPVPPPAA